MWALTVHESCTTLNTEAEWLISHVDTRQTRQQMPVKCCGAQRYCETIALQRASFWPHCQAAVGIDQSFEIAFTQAYPVFKTYFY